MDASTPVQESPVPDAIVPLARRRLTMSITPRTILFTVLVVIATIVLGYVVIRAADTIVLLLIAIIVGEAIRPLTQRLERYHIPGPLTVLLVFIAILAIFGAFLWLMINPLASEVGNLAANLPRYVEQLQRWGDQLQRDLRANSSLRQAINTISTSLAGLARQYLPALLSAPLAVLSALFTIIIDLVVILTMTIFWLMASKRLRPFVVGLFPPSSQEQASNVISEVGKGFGGYVRGTLISMALIGLLTGLGLALLGVPYALLLGILAALTELLPYLGDVLDFL